MTIENDDWYLIMRQTLERDPYTCRGCGKLEKENYRSLDVHHIVPAGKGGTDDLDNLITVCPECHPVEEAKSRPHIEMVERTFHIPEDIDLKLRMISIKEHLNFSEIATIAIKEHISVEHHKQIFF